MVTVAVGKQREVCREFKSLLATNPYPDFADYTDSQSGRMMRIVMVTPVKLPEVVDALEMQSNESRAYLNRSTGEVTINRMSSRLMNWMTMRSIWKIILSGS